MSAYVFIRILRLYTRFKYSIFFMRYPKIHNNMWMGTQLLNDLNAKMGFIHAIQAEPMFKCLKTFCV